MTTRVSRIRGAVTLIAFASTIAAAAPPATAPKRTMQEILAASAPSDWRTPDPEQLLYMDLPGGRVVIELAPLFAPRHVANIKALARAQFYDGLAIVRVQDNFVTQWGDAESTRSLGNAVRTLPAEFTRPLAADVTFTALPDRDGYAPEVGFVNGMPAARNTRAKEVWLAHCYGMVGVGRDDAADSGGGLELYAVIGHGPRQLDRNITVVGRVLRGMELLATQPRGGANMGFYDKPEQRVPLWRLRVAADIPANERVALQVFRTNTPAFAELVEARRNRSDAWYLVKAGHIDLCNVPLPVRESPSAASSS